MTVRPEFQFHTLNEQGIQRCNDTRAAFSETLTKIEQLVPPGRERALVVTKLQEACRWAVAGVAAAKENQLVIDDVKEIP